MSFGTFAFGTEPYGSEPGSSPTPPAPPAQVLPDISIEVSFTDPYGTLSWTDITKYALSFKTTMGRQHELQQVNPSTAQIVLYNGPVSTADPGGRFSPWNTNSPYYSMGNGIVPTVPVRIQATWDGITYPVFYGYADNWTPSYGQTMSTMTLNCSDILKQLNLNTLDNSPYPIYPLSNGTAYYTLGDKIGSTTAADSLGGTSGTVSGFSAFGASGPLLTLTTTALNILGYVSVPSSISGSTISVEGWLKTTTTDSFVYVSNDVSLALYTATSTGLPIFHFGGTVTLTGPTSVTDGNWHYLVGTADGTTARLYVDGELAVTAPCTSSFTSQVGQIANSVNGACEFGQIALYDIAVPASQVADQYQYATASWMVEDSGSRLSAVLEVCGVPTALNNVGTGITQVQAAVSSELSTTTAMSYINTVLTTENGLLFQDATGVVQFFNRHYQFQNSTSVTPQATFGYQSGQLHYFATGIVPAADDIDTWNNIPVQRINGVVQTASDATSQTLHGRRTLTGKTNLLQTSDLDCAGLSQYLLAQYKEPQIRVRSLTVANTIQSGMAMPQQLGRKLLDLISVIWRPLDGSTVDFEQASLIEQISHSVDAKTFTWTTTFAVTPIGTGQSYFTLDSATNGLLDVDELCY
jgi:hypothetical protein